MRAEDLDVPVLEDMTEVAEPAASLVWFVTKGILIILLCEITAAFCGSLAPAIESIW